TVRRPPKVSAPAGVHRRGRHNPLPPPCPPVARLARLNPPCRSRRTHAGSARFPVGRSRRRTRTVNKVLLTGRLTRDPEMRSLSSGKAVTQFSIATNEY